MNIDQKWVKDPLKQDTFFAISLQHFVEITKNWKFILFSWSYCTKMRFSIKDFLWKWDQICRFLRILSHFLKKSLMENFIFCAVSWNVREDVLQRVNSFLTDVLIFRATLKSRFCVKELGGNITNVPYNCSVEYFLDNVSLPIDLLLREKCPYMELFLVRIFLYSDWIQSKYMKIRTTNDSVFRHFSRSVYLWWCLKDQLEALFRSLFIISF